jgi:hypothetical protein
MNKRTRGRCFFTSSQYRFEVRKVLQEARKTIKNTGYRIVDGRIVNNTEVNENEQ